MCVFSLFSGGSRIDCRGGPSIPRALARAKFYVLRPLFGPFTNDVRPARSTHQKARFARDNNNYYSIVGCKHRASEVLLYIIYIGGRGLVSQVIEPVTFARCAFIIALRNIALDGYLDTRRNINFRTFTARRTA